MFVLVYLAPLVTAVTCGSTRESPAHASKMCTVGASLFVQLLLFADSTRMIVEVTPSGTL